MSKPKHTFIPGCFVPVKQQSCWFIPLKEPAYLIETGITISKTDMKRLCKNLTYKQFKELRK